MYFIPKEPVRARRQTDGAITPLRVNAGNELLVNMAALEFDAETDELLVKQGESPVNVQSIMEQMLRAGQAFTASFGADVGATTGTLDLLLVTPDTDMRIHLNYEIAVEGEAAVNLYEGAVATAADAVAAYNRDRNSATAATLVVTSTPTAITEGSTIVRQHHPIAGGVVKGGHELILKKNTNYLLRVANATGAANQTMVNLDWFEK